MLLLHKLFQKMVEEVNFLNYKETLVPKPYKFYKKGKLQIKIPIFLIYKNRQELVKLPAIIT